MIPICLLLWELRVRNKHSPPWIPLSNEMKNKSFGLLPRKISVKYSELIGGGLFIQQVFIEHLLCVICWTVNKVHMALIHRELTVPSPCKVSLALFVTGLILALFLIETLLSLSFKWREVHFLGHMIKKNRRSLEPSKDNSDFFFFSFALHLSCITLLASFPSTEDGFSVPGRWQNKIWDFVLTVLLWIQLVVRLDSICSSPS